MTVPEATGYDPWSEAASALAIFAVDPPGTGLRLRGRSGPVRDALLEHLAELLPQTPLRRIPVGIDETRLVGGLDLGATLAAARPVMQSGLLAEAHGGAVVIAMAERIERSTCALIEAALDTGESFGPAGRVPARIGAVALDEGIDEDEALAPSLADRLGLVIDLDAVPMSALSRMELLPEHAAVARARRVLSDVAVPDDAFTALVEIAAGFGIDSLRAVLAALRTARAAAALDGRTMVTQADLGLAARLVLLPRAVTVPQSPDEREPEPQEPEPAPENPVEEPESGSQENDTTDSDDSENDDPGSLADAVVEAVRAVLPPEVFAAIRDRAKGAIKSGARGRGDMPASGRRGRPAGLRQGRQRPGERLAVLATLRAAAPRQALRRPAVDAEASPLIRVRPEDFRFVRRKIRRRVATIFVVDASGSAALHRLAEAKGAVELMLAECYVRRDEVALIAFRGPGAETLLPPTRSLARAKRALGAIPGGGGTPLASGLDEALKVAAAVRKRGDTPVVILLTDGQANVARDGRGGRAIAGEEALAAASGFRRDGFDAVLIDTAPRPQPRAREIATAMGARYVALPQADAGRMAQAASAAARSARLRSTG